MCSGVKSCISLLSEDRFGDINWLIGTVLQSDVANKRFEEGTYSGLVEMSLELLELSLSLERLNSSYSESPSVIIISGGSTLSTGDLLPTPELVLHDFAGFDGLPLDFLFDPEQLCFEAVGWEEAFEVEGPACASISPR